MLAVVLALFSLSGNADCLGLLKPPSPTRAEILQQAVEKEGALLFTRIHPQSGIQQELLILPSNTRFFHRFYGERISQKLIERDFGEPWAPAFKCLIGMACGTLLGPFVGINALYFWNLDPALAATLGGLATGGSALGFAIGAKWGGKIDSVIRMKIDTHELRNWIEDHGEESLIIIQGSEILNRFKFESWLPEGFSSKAQS